MQIVYIEHFISLLEWWALRMMYVKDQSKCYLHV